jgi:hypothetical protein
MSVANLLGLLIFSMELNCLYVNCYVLCIFWQIMNTYLLNLMHKILICLCSTVFVLAREPGRVGPSRGELEPSLLFRLVCKTSQPEPSHFAASQSLARTEPGPSRLASSVSFADAATNHAAVARCLLWDCESCRNEGKAP